MTHEERIKVLETFGELTIQEPTRYDGARVKIFNPGEIAWTGTGDTVEDCVNNLYYRIYRGFRRIIYWKNKA